MNSKTSVLILAAVVGVSVGYFRLSSRGPDVEVALPQNQPAVTIAQTAAPETSAKRQEFKLLPADVQADREMPALTVDGRGRVLLAFASQTSPLERTLYLSRSADGRSFDKPSPFRKVPIYKYAAGSTRKKSEDKKPATSDKPAMTFSTHVLPRLVSHGDEITLGWVEAVNGGPKVVFYTATSKDGGATFTEPIAVHGEKASKPGFTSLATSSSGAVLAAWMDGGKPVASIKAANEKSFADELVAYPGPPQGGGICPCCDLAIVQDSAGATFVAFRNNVGDQRDMWIARSNGKGFDPAVSIGEHKWVFKGCPHDGPSLVAMGGLIKAVFMDASTGVNRIYFAESSADSLKFVPVELSPDSQGSQGHPKMIVAGKGLLAIWDESLDPALPKSASEADSHAHASPAAPSGSGRVVRYAVSTDARKFGPSKTIDVRAGSFQLNPAVVVLNESEALVAWNELDGDGKRIVLNTISLGQSGK
jgi:hypothetical protein